MSTEQEEQFEKLAEQYTMALHEMNNFITTNNLDFDTVWDKANQHYDEDCTYAPE